MVADLDTDEPLRATIESLDYRHITYMGKFCLRNSEIFIDVETCAPYIH